MRLRMLAVQVDRARRQWDMYRSYSYAAGEVLLEMHPDLNYSLWTDPDRLWAYGPPPDIGQVLGLPVKINPDLPRHSWRLVQVTVIGEGGTEPLAIVPKDGGW